MADHVLANPGPVEGERLAAAVPELAQDLDALAGFAAELRRAAEADVEPRARPQRLRAHRRRLGGSPERGAEQPPALEELTARHPHRPHRDGKAQRLLRV